MKAVSSPSRAPIDLSHAATCAVTSVKPGPAVSMTRV